MSANHITDTTSIDRAIAYQIHRMARLLRVHLNHVLKTGGVEVTAEQWFVLFRLYEHSPLAQNELADKELNDHPNITRMIDALEKRAWVQREQDPEDRRRHLISLTAHGEAQMAAILPTVIATRRALFAGISDQEIELLLTIFAKLEENLTERG